MTPLDAMNKLGELKKTAENPRGFSQTDADIKIGKGAAKNGGPGLFD
jgi:hypothetical protein